MARFIHHLNKEDNFRNRLFAFLLKKVRSKKWTALIEKNSLPGSNSFLFPYGITKQFWLNFLPFPEIAFISLNVNRQISKWEYSDLKA